MNKKIDDFDQYLDVIDRAMDIEKKSQKAYINTESETDNLKMKRWLSSLRFDEVIHFAMLERLGALIEDKKHILKKMEDEFSYPNLSREEAKNIYEGVQGHLKIERRQIERLEELEDIDLGLVDIENKIQWLKSEEENHHEKLKKFSQWLEENYDFH